jgi:hypothetical protein
MKRLWIIFGSKLYNFLRAYLIAAELFERAHFYIFKVVGLGHAVTSVNYRKK